MSETTHERSARYRRETERAVSKALRNEYRLRVGEIEARIEELRAQILQWQARIAELES